MIPSKYFIAGTQCALWVIFMLIDAWLLIPSIIFRYATRIKSKSETAGRRRPQTPKTVVIVGGNFAGLAALRELQNNPLFRIILIEPKEYFEYTPGILRLFCQPSLTRKLVHPLPHGSHQIVHGMVTNTDQQKQQVTYIDSVTRKSNQIRFDYLILATGSTYQYPVTAPPTETSIASRAHGWKVSAQKVQEAKSILILGGGPVGTELAAELVDHYPNSKSITLVDACPRLVTLFSTKVSDYAAEWLQARGCRLILGQMLEKWDSTSCTLKNGDVLRADLVFVCFGDKPNSGPLVGNHKASNAITNGTNGNKKNKAKKQSSNAVTSAAGNSNIKLDKRKCIQVDAFLRVVGVQGRNNIFCCGNVAAPPTEDVKQAFQAEVQGHVAGENVIRLATGQKFIRYPEDAAMGSRLMPLIYCLSLGRWDGVIGFNSFTLPGPLAPVLKWIIEWTKIRHMMGRPVGTLIWIIADAVVFFTSKNIFSPGKKVS